MNDSCMVIKPSVKLSGEIALHGAKNAVLAIMASLLLTRGKSTLTNVPNSADVHHMIHLLRQLGADVVLIAEEHELIVDTTRVTKWLVDPEIMNKMRASVLVMGPLLARFGRADIALPGGCIIGSRPIDYHLKNFKKMGVAFETHSDCLFAYAMNLYPQRLVLDYPSVGATENLMMASVLVPGKTVIINASLEPEVMDLISVLRKMGSHITVVPPATIEITGQETLHPVAHAIMPDRLEAGAILLAGAITSGDVSIPQLPQSLLDVFLLKLEEMGHTIIVGEGGIGITLKATTKPRAVSFKTGPFPGFPTDLQAPMMALQTIAQGTAVIEEAVFENRLVHVRELQKMGAQIKVDGNKAIVTGVDELYGAHVIATDIRASCSLVLAGMVAKGVTVMTGLHHWRRGYDALEQKLVHLGANVAIEGERENIKIFSDSPLQVPFIR